LTSRNRNAGLPDVPVLADTLPGFELTSWIAVWAPAGTDSAIINKLNAAVQAVLADDALAKRLSEVGFVIEVSTPQALGDKVIRESTKWQSMVKEAGIEPQ